MGLFLGVDGWGLICFVYFALVLFCSLYRSPHHTNQNKQIDKILDIDEDTSIISCSLGAARWYHLRDDVKNPTTEEKILLQPGGLMILGPKTNHNYYHSVPKLEEKEGGEKEEVGPRISITLRRTLTYKDRKGVITGKGEEYQSANWPKELKGSHRIEEEGEKEG